MSDMTSNIITNKEKSMSQDTTVNAVAENLMEGVKIVVSGGSKGTAKQQADALARGKLIAKILADSKDEFDYTTLLKSQTESGNEIQNKLDAALKQAAQLQQEKDEAGGGMGDMIDSLTNMASGIFE